MSEPALSNEAKGVASLFAINPKFSLSFRMVASRPTEKMQAALDELVGAGVLVRQALPGGGAEYKALVDCHQYRGSAKHAKFPITEPMPA